LRDKKRKKERSKSDNDDKLLNASMRVPSTHTGKKSNKQSTHALLL